MVSTRPAKSSPAWLDGVVCTPAVHWHHHGRAQAASDGNFGTTVTLLDRLLGTYLPPAPREEVEVGADGVVIPPGLAAQVLDPFRPGRAPVAGSSAPMRAKIAAR